MKSLCVPVVLSLVLVLLLHQAPSARADSLSKEQVESAVDEALDKLNKQQVSTRKLALAEEQDIQVSFNVSTSNFTDVDTKTNLDKMIKIFQLVFLPQADETDDEGQTNIKFAVVETECNADDPKDWSDCPISEDKTPIDGQCEVTVLKTEDSLDVGDASCDLTSMGVKTRGRRGWLKKTWRKVKNAGKRILNTAKHVGRGYLNRLGSHYMRRFGYGR
uniref:Uncharacterized protein n=1 Tax=Eptatretus burgeri TaxID=7764 RepID=A0A8C4X0R9_EPTBU